MKFLFEFPYGSKGKFSDHDPMKVIALLFTFTAMYFILCTKCSGKYFSSGNLTALSYHKSSVKKKQKKSIHML